MSSTYYCLYLYIITSFEEKSRRIYDNAHEYMQTHKLLSIFSSRFTDTYIHSKSKPDSVNFPSKILLWIIITICTVFYMMIWVIIRFQFCRLWMVHSKKWSVWTGHNWIVFRYLYILSNFYTPIEIIYFKTIFYNKTKSKFLVLLHI